MVIHQGYNVLVQLGNVFMFRLIQGGFRGEIRIIELDMCCVGVKGEGEGTVLGLSLC